MTDRAASDTCGERATAVIKRVQEFEPKEALRKVMGRYATGATIVTGFFDQRPHGMAVNSFTSVSLSPPMILFCPGKDSETWPAIEQSGHFAVNILGCRHGDLCRKFARKGQDRFTEIPFARSQVGNPLLEAAIAYIDCRLDRIHDAGDHYIAIGHVLDLGVRQHEPPLVFYEGAFHGLKPVEKTGAGGA